MKRSAIILAALILVQGATLKAQPVEVDLKQAIAIALSDNPTIKIADLEVERQDYVKKETWGNLMPNLSSTVSFSSAINKTTMNFGGQRVSLAPDNTSSFGATLSLPLFVPGVYQSLKLNNEQMRAAVESARGSRLSISCEVKKAFYNILRVEQEIAVLNASVKTVSETVDQVKVSYTNGLAAEYDLLTAQVQLSNLTPLILQAEKGLSIAQMYLKMLMGMPLEQQVAFKGDLVELEDNIASSSYDINLTNNTDLRSLDIQEDVLARQIKVLRTQRMPTLGASLAGSIDGTSRTSISFSGEAPEKVFEWQQPVNFGASLSIPIFAGFTNTSREKQLKNSLKQLQTNRDYAEKQIEVAANDAVSSVYTAGERMKATAITVEQAQKAYDISAVRYKAGAGTILELNAAELQLTQSQLNHSQAVYEMLSAQAEYQKLIGNE